jgi:ubiquinone/menaquinone biosynthesis C-methylase UbiE
LLMSAFDVVAPAFDCYRALPIGVPEAIRAAILSSTSASSRPRLLDLGAGSGRVGWPFVVAGDDYIGVDVSSGMLQEFAQRAAARGEVSPRLVQADGQHLPFRDATFDIVMLIQIFGGLRGWRRLIAEARRVLRPVGALIVGRTIVPPDGLDPRMKQHLAAILDELGILGSKLINCAAGARQS